MTSRCRTALFRACFGLVFIASVFIPSVHADIIVSVDVENRSSSSRSSVPTTFGHTFKPGDFPAGQYLTAKIQGQTIPTQVDVKASHADGSVRHAIITVRVPTISANASQKIDLDVSSSNPSGSDAVTVSDLLASNFDAELSLNVGSQTYVASARDLIASGNYQTWLSGDEVTEWIVGGPLTSAGGEHPHLAAYFHVRAYSGIDSVRVDVVVENGWTFAANPRDFSYSGSLKLGTNTVALPFNGSLNHYHHTRWHKQYVWGNSLPIYVRHDTNYLQDSKAVPKYQNVPITSGYLSSMANQQFVPMQRGELTANFGNTGAQDQIGPLPRWTTTYVITGDHSAFNSMRVNDDSAGTYAAHYRDKQTGLPFSFSDHPNATIQESSTVPPGSGSNPYALDQAHQPSIAYVSYLVTGDYYYLEELQFWVSWNDLFTHPVYRQYNGTRVYQGQVRGQAWALRALGHAAYITPDDHPLKSHLLANINHNIVAVNATYANNPNSNALHAMTPYNGNLDARPWMDDFYTWSIGNLVDLGFTNAKSMLDWKAVYVANRLGASGEYCWQFAPHYVARFGPSDGEWFSNFTDYYNANWGNSTSGGVALKDVACGTQAMADWLTGSENRTYQVNEFTGGSRPSSPDSYYANMQPAVAALVDSELAGSDVAGARFFSTPVRPDFTDKPNWAVIPRLTVGTPPIIEQFSANPVSVDQGNTSTLSWVVQNADTCSAEGDWNGSRALVDTEITTPLNSDSIFTLSCENNQGLTASRSVTVVLNQQITPPSVPNNPPSTTPQTPPTNNTPSNNTPSNNSGSSGGSSDDEGGGSGNFGPVILAAILISGVWCKRTV